MICFWVPGVLHSEILVALHFPAGSTYISGGLHFWKVAEPKYIYTRPLHDLYFLFSKPKGVNNDRHSREFLRRAFLWRSLCYCREWKQHTLAMNIIWRLGRGGGGGGGVGVDLSTTCRETRVANPYRDIAAFAVCMIFNLISLFIEFPFLFYGLLELFWALMVTMFCFVACSGNGVDHSTDLERCNTSAFVAWIVFIVISRFIGFYFFGLACENVSEHWCLACLVLSQWFLSFVVGTFGM